MSVTMFYKQGDRVKVNDSAMPPTHAGEIGKVTGIIKASGGYIYQVELPIEDRPAAPVLLLSASEIDPAPKEKKPASHWQSGFE